LPTLRRIIVGAVIGFLTLTAIYAWSPAIDLTFRADRPEQRRVLRGFYTPEIDPAGAFAWTQRSAEWRLRDLNRSNPWMVELRLRAAVDAGSQASIVILVDGVQVARVIGRDEQDVRFVIPPASHDGATLGLAVAHTVVPGGNDARELGAAVRWLRLTRSGATQLSVPRRLAFAATMIGGAVGAVAGVVALGAIGTAAMLVLTCGLWSVLAVTGFAPITEFPNDSVRALAAIGAIASVGLVWRRSRSWSAYAGRALAVVAAAAFVRLCLILHPSFVLGDSGFHLHRLQAILGGDYFFLSNAPGGAFPYAPAFYVIVKWMTSWTRGWITLMRTVALAFDMTAALLIYPLVLRHWQTGRAAVIAVLLYVVVPAGFQVHAIAYLTNAFAQSVAVIGLILLALTTDGDTGRRWPVIVGAFLALTIASLSHTGTFFILCVLLALLPTMFLSIGDCAARSLAPIAATAGIVAITASVILYYGHFGSVYMKMLAQPSMTSASGSAPAPTQRAEAHQTQWVPGSLALKNRLAAVPGYVSKYLGFVLCAAGVVGGALLVRRRARDPLTLLLFAWCASCSIFFVLGQLTPIDVRYYLAVFPALAILVSRAIDEAWAGGTVPRAVASGVLLWCVATGVIYWYGWFGAVLPR
jgi:hypothetical protein